MKSYPVEYKGTAFGDPAKFDGGLRRRVTSAGDESARLRQTANQKLNVQNNTTTELNGNAKRITDVDKAKESAGIKQQVLQQTATQTLSAANKGVGSVLDMLM